MKHYKIERIGPGYTVVDENNIVAISAAIMPKDQAQDIADNMNETEIYMQMAKSFLTFDFKKQINK